jgi:hypothetical protein
MNKALQQARTLSVLLDSKFRLPGGFRIGLDGIIGLIPGVGDAITSLLSLYILFLGVQVGCSPALLGRMAFNIAFDTALTAVPIFGNVADFFWKSNNKNFALIEAYVANPRKARLSAYFFFSFIAIFVMLVCAGAAWLAWLLGSLLWNFIASL